MTPHSIDQASERGLRAWLAAPVHSSPFQARMQQLSLKWWRLRANPAAMFGLAIIVLIALVALFAPREAVRQSLERGRAPVHAG